MEEPISSSGRRDRVSYDRLDRSGRVVLSGGSVFRDGRTPTHDGRPMVAVGRRRVAIRIRRRLPNKGQAERGRRRRLPAVRRRQPVQERATAVPHDFGRRIQVPAVRHFGRPQRPVLQAHRPVHGAAERLQTLGDKK